jgi:hypothetical protein
MKRTVSPFVTASGVLALSLLAGCSGGNTGATVRGEVTLDGQPLKQGIIRFVPLDGKTPTADTGITNGKFNATVTVGEMKVEITAPKVIGKHKMYDTPESPVVEDVVELVPSRYNVRSELQMTVKRGSQERRFELKSK